ncbi:hypothetical protein D3C85_1640270 [compost metagenome]
MRYNQFKLEITGTAPDALGGITLEKDVGKYPQRVRKKAGLDSYVERMAGVVSGFERTAAGGRILA